MSVRVFGSVFSDLQIKLSPWFESSKILSSEKIYSRIPSRVVETQGGEVARDLKGGALRPSEGKRYIRGCGLKNFLLCPCVEL